MKHFDKEVEKLTHKKLKLEKKMENTVTELACKEFEVEKMRLENLKGAKKAEERN